MLVRFFLVLLYKRGSSSCTVLPGSLVQEGVLFMYCSSLFSCTRVLVHVLFFLVLLYKSSSSCTVLPGSLVQEGV